MSANLPLISVIVPNYNHENYLKQRLDSIFSQTYQNFEVILLDDCSTDKSRDILSEYAKSFTVRNCVFNQTNSGNTFKQWKKGIELAKGDFIWIAESDDFCDATFLEKVSKPLFENESIGLSYCQSNRVNDKGEITGSWATQTENIDSKPFEGNFVENGNLFIDKYLIFNNVIPNASAVLMRKKVLLSLGKSLVEEDLKYCGDWLLYFKILLNSKVAFFAKPLNSFRYHSESVINIAAKDEKRISIIDIDIKMRKKMVDFLKNNKPENYSSIIKNNCNVVNAAKYEKGFIYIQNNQKIKGIFILISIFSFFKKKYQLRKKLILKFKKIFS